jgi:malate dehydrogenase
MSLFNSKISLLTDWSKINGTCRSLITCSAGNIAYSLVARIWNGDLLGTTRKVILHLLDLPQCLQKLSILAMESEDSAFPRLAGIIYSDDISVVAKDVEYAFVLASVPLYWKEGIEPRSFYIPANVTLYQVQGEALSNFAKPTVKIIVVDSPPNTNALVAMKSAPKLGPQNWGSSSFLDHTRLLSYVSRLVNVPITAVHKASIWGNHSPSEVVYGFPAEVEKDGELKKLTDLFDQDFLKGEFVETIAERGYIIVRAKGGASSVLSTASSILQMMKNWIFGSKGEWDSMGISSSEKSF